MRLTSLLVSALALGGCAVVPQTVRVEYEHISHPGAGWPVERQSATVDNTVDHIVLSGGWTLGGVDVTVGVGRKIVPYRESGFKGPKTTGVLRVGRTWRLR